MRKFGMLPCALWQDARITRQGRDCVILAVYLLSNPHGNTIHLYHLPVPYIAADTGLDIESIRANIAHLVGIGFCLHDPESSFVWLRDQMVQALGHALKPTDKRIAGIRTLLSMLPDVSLVRQFKAEFADAYRLNDKGASEGASKDPSKQVEVEEQVEVDTTRNNSFTRPPAKNRKPFGLKTAGGRV